MENVFFLISIRFISDWYNVFDQSLQVSMGGGVECLWLTRVGGEIQCIISPLYIICEQLRYKDKKMK